jgi:protein TonB
VDAGRTTPGRAGVAIGLSLFVHAAFLFGVAKPEPEVTQIAPVPLQFQIQELAPEVTAPELTPPEPEVAEPPPVVEEAPPPPPEPKPLPKPVPKPKPKPVPKPKPKPAPKPQPKAVAKPAPAPVAQPTATPEPLLRARYEDALAAWLARHKDYPMIARRRGIEGTVRLRVKVDRGGNVLSSQVVSGSGSAILDQASLRMVDRADPFPSMPKDYPGDSFQFVIPVDFELN